MCINGDQDRAIDGDVQGKTVVAITSGANMNFDRLRLVADLAAVGARQEAILVIIVALNSFAFAPRLSVC